MKNDWALVTEEGWWNAAKDLVYREAEESERAEAIKRGVLSCESMWL